MNANPIPNLSEDETVRFWSRVDKANINGCWLWTGQIDRHGYGRIKLNQIDFLAHRVSYAIENGETPTNLSIDHVRDRGCSHRNCVNPAHLEPVSLAVNTQRGDAPSVLLNRAGTCKHGHTALVKRKHGNACLICGRENSRRYTQRLRAKELAS